MHYILLLLIIIAIIFGPQWWARYTFQRYATPLDRIQGTGGELARHLLDRFDLTSVTVEQTVAGNDHYDPKNKAVRLSPMNFNDKSLTAVAVAAHEVGHAIQDARNEPMLIWRTRLAILANAVQKLGAAAMIAMPVVAAITRAPSGGIALLVIGLGSMFLASIVHFVTLPVELDASFNKALPILNEGYVEECDRPVVRKILRAAALTYLAGSLASLLNLWRWMRILRR